MNEPSLDTSTQLAAIAELHAAFGDRGIPYWIFGGWAVDFHVGRVTRSHDDIDIAIWEHDRPLLAELLAEFHWTHTPDVDEAGYTSYARDTVRLEVAFLARDAVGEVFTPLASGRGDWPPETFGDDILTLGDVTARVIRRRALLADKSITRIDATTAAKDHADVDSLSREPH